MPMHDAILKKGVQQILESCRADNLILGKEVCVNIVGDRDEQGKLLTEKEIDVIAKFTYGGKKILLLFECEDTNSASGLKKKYKNYAADVASMLENLDRITVLQSTEGSFKSRDFRDVDIVRVCFVYGDKLPEASYRTAQRHAEKHDFLVWNRLALTYYRRVSSVLGRWSRYELFRDFGLKLESVSTFTIKALEVQQKDRKMYFGHIHPGQLLKIAYVVRRASEKKYAYQRLLNKDRIDAIGDFIESKSAQSFLPNSVLIVFDSDSNIASQLKYDSKKHELTIPNVYCSAWIIDGQHRAYGFLGTRYENWEQEKFEPFDLPVIIFKTLPETVQTETFININYFQKRIKAGLVCDLTTLTKDLQHKLTWPSLLGRELNYAENSPLRDIVKVSELHGGRPISLSSLVQYGLLETLLGYRPKNKAYAGPLFGYAAFNAAKSFESPENKKAFDKHLQLLIRFLDGARKNTSTGDEKTDPWKNYYDYSLLRPTGINALLMVLAKILRQYPNAGVDFVNLLKPLKLVSYTSNNVAKKGGGWKGFRGLANTMIRRLNKSRSKKNKFALYGQKDKL